MNPYKTHPDRATTPRRDPMRWKVAALVALALFGIGAMHTYVLMFRNGEDLLAALIEAGPMILIAAIPIGYLVYRSWFEEREFAPVMSLNGFNAGSGFDENEFAWNNSLFDDSEEGGFMCGAQGCGYYSGGIRIDDDHD